ncbi:MAG TPA: WYL domain-containing protein, partial [Arenimonas sp.]|nr:WYL domain-containing protein [Arenimonas sp.]
PTDHLQAIAHCVWNQRIATMQYESWNGEKTRTIRPLGLILKAGIWYTVALADESREPRIYRLSNILQLAITETKFRRPKKFDLAEFWKQSTQRFETEIYRDEATLLVTSRGMKRLLELSAAVGEAAKRSAVADSANAGWTKVVVPIESIEFAAGQLLSIGADVRVLEPQTLRTSIRELLDRISFFY